jgi:Flp pilus assembly protein TadB
MRLVRCCLTRTAVAFLASGAAWLSVPWTAAQAGPSAAGERPAVMILLDINTSLYGSSLSSERTAAVSYVRALPPGVRAGLITFSSRWRVVLVPTADRTPLIAALSARMSGGATSRGLSSALSGAAVVLARLGATPHDRLLVLSDGEYLQGTLAVGHIRADAVTFHLEADDRDGRVRALAVATGGRVATPAGAASLAAIMATAPAAVKTPAPKTGGAPARMTVRKTAVADSTALPMGLAAGVFATFFLLALMGIGGLRTGDRGRRRLAQLERYGARPGRDTTEPGGERKAVTAALGMAARLLRSSNTEPALAGRLDAAGITRKPAEWALLGTSATVALIAALTLATGNVLLAVLIGVPCGWLGMRLALSIRISRRRAAFADQLPEMLQLVAGSLQAGFSLPQALDGLAREETQPSSGEISRALAEVRIGVDLEVALGAVAERMDSDDMRWTVMAIRIQREVGGNLVEVLRNTVATMRERAFLRRQVRSLSGEGRLSAYILVALPIVVGGWLFYSSPSYMRPLYTTVTGVLMLGGAGVLFVLGAFWMRTLIKVEV